MRRWTSTANPGPRFVTGFIGFIEGRLNGDVVNFSGFNVARSNLDTTSIPAGVSTFSVRPQSMGVLANRPTEANQLDIPGKITTRTFLGETWDYTFDSGSGSVCASFRRPPSHWNESACLAADRSSADRQSRRLACSGLSRDRSQQAEGEAMNRRMDLSNASASAGSTPIPGPHARAERIVPSRGPSRETPARNPAIVNPCAGPCPAPQTSSSLPPTGYDRPASGPAPCR
jgi:hypothetical protein